jgi:hypothetical protein
VKLQTRILATGGCLRFGIPVLLLLLSQLHVLLLVVIVPLIALWLRYCRLALRHVLLPPLFPNTRCPACRYLIPLRQIWGCQGGHYNDHRVRHVLQFHCNEGHEIRSFQCPKKNCNKTTIQVQKGIDSKVSKAFILGNAFAIAPGERRPSKLRGAYRRLCFWKQKPQGMKLRIGYDRRFLLSRFQQWLRRALRLRTRRAIEIAEAVYGRHMTIFGKSGMGKSKLILSMVQWMMQRGMGLTIIDPAGDLATEIIRHVPRERMKDVLWIRISDRKCPFRLNVLEAHDEIEEINLNEELLSALKRMSQSWGDQIAYQIEVAIDTSRAMGGSLKDVYDLFTNTRVRDRIVSQIDDPELIEFWEKYERTRESSRAPVIRKLRSIVKHKLLGPMLSARQSNFDPDVIIRERQIVVIDLSTGSTSEHVNVVIGTLIVSKIMAAAFRQKFKKEAERVRHFLIVDEAKNFIHRGTNFERIFSEARKFKLSLVLANQHVTQLTEEVRDAAFSNAGVLLTFNVDDDDAKLFEKRMRDVTVEDITGQEVGECIVRIHNDTEFIKTELPKLPAFDPTAEIDKQMHALNATVSANEDTDEITVTALPSARLPEYFVDVCEGVR